MAPDEIQTALASAVEEVLETMCFTTVLASAEGAPPPSPPKGDGAGADENRTMAAELSFQGSLPGRFRVSVSPDLAREIAAGFLGCEQTDVLDSQVTEVICELANMICGSVLSLLESEAAFHLCPPELIQPEAGLVSSSAETSRRFDLGNGVLTASVELRAAV